MTPDSTSQRPCSDGLCRAHPRLPRYRLGVIATLLATLLHAVAVAAPPEPAGGGEARRYTFSWPFTDDDAMRPRGGTTHGPDVTLSTAPSDAFERLTERGLTDLERDRRAILAMAGAYRTTFDFIETIGFTPGYRPTRPYQSWATEYIEVIADQPRHIGLQHILVMTFVDDAGAVSEPVVVKHWRQDWRFEDSDIHVYTGHGHWQRRTYPPAEVRGTWSQAVFQVDDSPRYQAIGRWQHHGNHSTWTSERTWRPLPRRESSVRSDYDALVGINRVTIDAQGWIHEEDNLKAVLEAPGKLAPESPFLAREAGLNRYRHIVGYDFSAGERYWRQTAPFWGAVRDAWGRVFAEHDAFTVADTVDDERLFEVMFELAERFAGDAYDAAAARTAIDDALARFVRT